MWSDMLAKIARLYEEGGMLRKLAGASLALGLALGSMQDAGAGRRSSLVRGNGQAGQPVQQSVQTQSHSSRPWRGAVRHGYYPYAPFYPQTYYGNRGFFGLGYYHGLNLVPQPVYVQPLVIPPFGDGYGRGDIRMLESKVDDLGEKIDQYADVSKRPMDERQTRQFVHGLLDSLKEQGVIKSYGANDRGEFDYDFWVTRGLESGNKNIKTWTHHIEVGDGVAINYKGVKFSRISPGLPDEVAEDLYHALGMPTR